MIFGAPAMLWWLTIMLPVAGLFFYRRRRTILEFPAIELWLQDERSRNATRLGSRFSRLLTLLAQLLILACLVAALTDPNSAETNSHFVIVLDDSATMQTRESSNETRFDRAKQIASERVRAELPIVPVSVILAGEPPNRAIYRESDHTLAESSIADTNPRDVNARLDRSLRQAQSMTETDPTARVIVLTDQPAPPALQSSGIEWIKVGTTQPNISITALDMSDDHDAVIVVLAQTGFSESTAAVRLTSDGNDVSRNEVKLLKSPVDVELPASLPDGATFEIRVEPSDALELDNIAYGVWPTGRDVRIRLASDDDIPLLAALSMPGVTVELVAADKWDVAGDCHVTVIDSTSRINPNARGRFLVFGGVDPFRRTESAPTRTDLRPTQWQPDSPILSDVNLLSWQITRSAGIGPDSRMTSFAESDDVPLVFALDERSQEEPLAEDLVVLYVNFCLQDSNLLAPSNMSFPIFVLNAIDYLLDASSAQMSLANATGRPHLLPGFSTDGGVVRQFQNNPHPVYIVGDRLMMESPNRAGLYQVADSNHTRWLAFDWFPSVVESDYDDAWVKEIQNSGHLRFAFASPLWHSLLIIGVLFIAAEFALFHRSILRMS